MQLEKEINQRKFRSETHKLAVNLIFTFHWLHRYQTEWLKPYSITLQQYNVLRILRGQHPECASIKLIRERMLDKMSDASRIVEKLRQNEYVNRKISPVDRRECEVTITDKGLHILAEIDKLDENIDQLFSRLTEEDKLLANNLLDRLRG